MRDDKVKKHTYDDDTTLDDLELYLIPGRTIEIDFKMIRHQFPVSIRTCMADYDTVSLAFLIKPAITPNAQVERPGAKHSLATAY